MTIIITQCPSGRSNHSETKASTYHLRQTPSWFNMSKNLYGHMFLFLRNIATGRQYLGQAPITQQRSSVMSLVKGCMEEGETSVGICGPGSKLRSHVAKADGIGGLAACTNKEHFLRKRRAQKS